MMPGRRDHLQLVGGRRFWVRPQPRMQVATQAIFAGPQDHRVFAMTPQATGRGYGHIAVRVGRILVYLEDRDALQAWTTAILTRPGPSSNEDFYTEVVAAYRHYVQHSNKPAVEIAAEAGVPVATARRWRSPNASGRRSWTLTSPGSTPPPACR